MFNKTTVCFALPPPLPCFWNFEKSCPKSPLGPPNLGNVWPSENWNILGGPRTSWKLEEPIAYTTPPPFGTYEARIMILRKKIFWVKLWNMRFSENGKIQRRFWFLILIFAKSFRKNFTFPLFFSPFHRINRKLADFFKNTFKVTSFL